MKNEEERGERLARLTLDNSSYLNENSVWTILRALQAAVDAPDKNAGILSFLASHLLSSFQFQRHGLAPGSDVLSVLSRVEFYMNEKDSDSAARELNQLTDPANELLHDWLEAARRRLEVQQALEVIQAQATLVSLLVV